MASKSECSQNTKCRLPSQPLQAKVVGQESSVTQKKLTSENSSSTANNVVSEKCIGVKGEGEGEKEMIRIRDKKTVHEVQPPSLYSLGVYYGGREFYSPPRTPTADTTVNEDDGGNWWLGSVYY